MTLPESFSPLDETSIDRVIEQRNADNKRSDSQFAVITWIGCSIWWLYSTPEAHFFSWQAAVMIIPGMFAASIILGGGSYLLKMGLQDLILRLPSHYQALPAALGGLLVLVGEVLVTYRLSGLVLSVLIGLGQLSTASGTTHGTVANHAIPLTSEQSAQLRDLYLTRLDTWVSSGGKPTDAQRVVVETCGLLVMVTASASEATAFMKERRDDLDFRVDVCSKLTVTRVHPQPEFTKPEIRKIVCEAMPKEQAIFGTLCKRAGLL